MDEKLRAFSAGDKPYMALAYTPHGNPAAAEHRIIDRKLRVLAIVDPLRMCADPAGLAECIARDMNVSSSGASVSQLVGKVRELADELESNIELHIYDGDEPANAPERKMVADARVLADRAEACATQGQPGSLALPPIAFAAIYEHKHGRTITIHATHAQANAVGQIVAFQSWEELFPEEQRPGDMEKLAERYFARAAEIGDEFFSIEECPVDGIDPHSQGLLITALRAIKDRWPADAPAPEPETYDDTESAYSNGEDVSTHEAAVIAGQALEAYGTVPAHDCLLDINTAHLSQSTRNLLDSLSGEPDAAFAVGATGFGWFTHALEEKPGEADEDYPADLRAAWAFARKQGCCYVLFDGDAPAYEDLPTYEDGTNLVEWTRPAYPGDHLRRTDLRKGDELGFITIQSWNDITFRIGAFLPGNTVCPPGDTPKTEPEKDEWATREAADSIFDRYVEEAKADGWEPDR